MNHWTISSFLFALLLIVLGTAVLGTLLQRTLFKEEKPKSGTEIFVEWNTRKLRGSLATIIGLAVAMLVYPQITRLGLSDHKWFIGIVLVVGLLVMMVLIRLRQLGDE